MSEHVRGRRVAGDDGPGHRAPQPPDGPPPPAPPAVPVAPRMLTCPNPGCGYTYSELTTRTPLAADFCPVCDYPLFFAPVPDDRATQATDDDDRSLRRLPGVEGRREEHPVPCPYPDCAENNRRRATRCNRCARPIPIPVELVAPAPEPPRLRPPPVMAVAPSEPTPWWVWAGLGSTALLLVVLLVVLLST